MIRLILLPLLTIIYLTSVTGKTKPTSFNQDLVTYIDYEKYLENEGKRFRRQTENIVNTIIGPVAPPSNGYVPFQNVYYPRYNYPSNGFGPLPWYEFQNYGYNQQRYQAPVSVCADPVNEVYQECGSKCVLGCRYSNTRDSRITVFESDCDKNVCVAGCFCKAGLVRHQSRCIPATECPIPKCQQNEVYQCGSAVPITCQNIFRSDEIAEETKNLDCIWGCSCAKGYVLKSDDGQCVPESDCISSPTNEDIGDTTRLLGENSVRHLFRPSNNPHYESCFGPSCKESYQSKPSSGKPSKPKPGKPQVTITNHNVGANSKPDPHNKPTHHTHHAGGSGNIAINNYNNFVNEQSNKANGTGWGFIPYPVIPIYPYNPGNETGGSSSESMSNNNSTIIISNSNDNANNDAGNGDPSNTVNNNTVDVTIPNNNNNSNINNLTSSPVTQGSGSTDSNTPLNITNNNTNMVTSNNDNGNNITLTIPTNGATISIPINNNNGGASSGGTIPGTNITIPGINLPGTGAILNIPGVGIIIGTIIPGVQIPGLPGINLPNITTGGGIGINIPGLGNVSIGTGGIDANIGIPGLINIGGGLSPSGVNVNASIPGVSANVGTSGAGLNIGIPGIATAGVNIGQRDEEYTNTNQDSPSAPPMYIKFDPSNYLKPNREQNVKKEQNIKTQTSTNRPNSMKKQKPNLTQYIPQPNSYVNAAPNLITQPTYFGANPFGQYQYSAPPQYSNGYFNNPQNFQPNYQGYPPFRYRKRK